MRRFIPFALAGMIAATLVVPSIAGAAPTGVRYDSTPAPGTVTVPSVGPEAYSFNQVGNEVILKHKMAIKHVSVTMVSWACQSGHWTGLAANGGRCLTTPGATFRVPITLKLRAHSTRDADTGVIRPGRMLGKVTKTFHIRYRPSSQSASESRYMGIDDQLHNGIAQTITFPITTKLGSDVVWTVSYNTAHSGPQPVGHATPADSLNVGLSPSVRLGHDRYSDSLMWDTREMGNTGGAPFAAGQLNLDSNAWHGYVPAARFSTH